MTTRASNEKANAHLNFKIDREPPGPGLIHGVREGICQPSGCIIVAARKGTPDAVEFEGVFMGGALISGCHGGGRGGEQGEGFVRCVNDGS